MKKYFLSLIIVILSFTSCSYDNDDNIAINSDTKWWILVHPTHGNEGIYLYNETNSSIERIIELPNQMSSPHALDFDGEFLWLGGMGNEESIYKLSPDDGTVISEIVDKRTEGIKFLNGEIYYSLYGRINKITEDGTFIEEILLPTSQNPTDIAIKNSVLYYVENGVTDPIFKFNLENSNDGLIVNTEVDALYTLTILNDNLIVVTNNNEIRRFNINSGELVSDSVINIDGWITAITPYESQVE